MLIFYLFMIIDKEERSHETSSCHCWQLKRPHKPILFYISRCFSLFLLEKIVHGSRFFSFLYLFTILSSFFSTNLRPPTPLLVSLLFVRTSFHSRPVRQTWVFQAIYWVSFFFVVLIVDFVCGEIWFLQLNNQLGLSLVVISCPEGSGVWRNRMLFQCPVLQMCRGLSVLQNPCTFVRLKGLGPDQLVPSPVAFAGLMRRNDRSLWTSTLNFRTRRRDRRLPRSLRLVFILRLGGLWMWCSIYTTRRFWTLFLILGSPQLCRSQLGRWWCWSPGLWGSLNRPRPIWTSGKPSFLWEKLNSSF